MQQLRLPVRIGLLATMFAVLPAPLRAEPVSFTSDVRAVLSRGGCNHGACHNNQNGGDLYVAEVAGQRIHKFTRE